MKLTTRLVYALFGHPFAHALKGELAVLRSRVRHALSPRQRARLRQLRTGTDLRLHLGCGDRILAGWVNMDVTGRPGVDLVLDLRRPLPLPDGCAAYACAEHFLEHLTREEAHAVLGECRRVLRPGGRLRIGVPDAGLYARKYAEGDTAFFAGLRHLGGAVRPLVLPMEVLDQMARMGGAHLCMWDEATLRAAFADAGFTEIVRTEAGASPDPVLRVDDPAHAFETLYMEGTSASGSLRR